MEPKKFVIDVSEWHGDILEKEHYQDHDKSWDPSTMCEEVILATSLSWRCTRPKNHKDLHEAGFGGRAGCGARWDREFALLHSL